MMDFQISGFYPGDFYNMGLPENAQVVRGKGNTDSSCASLCTR